MLEKPKIRRAPIRVLRDSVARKIAAGEVIERPASAVRELIDNSLDAGSTEIALYITGGGIESIRVVDNGCGMSEEDLKLCWLPHATSKIESEEDLLHIRSLGFRGEALSALANVSRLEIQSRPSEEEIGHRLVVHGGQWISLEPHATRPGTVVTASDLFYALPARRKFLKRPSTETNLCRNTFLEKALPFPDREFKLFVEGKMTHFLPISPLSERIAQAYPEETGKAILQELIGSGKGFQFRIVTGSPEIYRKDRKHLQLYVNHRRIWDFTLLQGVEYAFSSYLPGGTFPLCYLFVEIDPEWVDFNIHPAKKEARIRNTEDIRRRISEVLSSFLASRGRLSLGSFHLSPSDTLPNQPPFSLSNDDLSSLYSLLPHQRPSPLSQYGPSSSHSPSPDYSHPREQASLWVGEGGGSAADRSSSSLVSGSHSPSYGVDQLFPANRTTGEDSFIYKGQVFGLFLLVERKDTMFLVDQHAAHERFIYDALSRDRVPQPLLIPLEFPVEPEEEERIRENAANLTSLGVQIEEIRPGTWALTALPAAYRGAEEDVVTLLKTQTGTGEKLKQELFAQIACKKAIKDGEGISPLSAYEILHYVFSLENPRCPHGRPLWVQISREELFRGVRRIL